MCKGAENRLPSFPRAPLAPRCRVQPWALPAGSPGSESRIPRGERERVKHPRPRPVLWVGVAWKGTVVILSPQKLEIGLKRCFRMGASRPPRCRLSSHSSSPLERMEGECLGGVSLQTLFPRREGTKISLPSGLCGSLPGPSAWESLCLNLKGCQAPPSY